MGLLNKVEQQDNTATAGTASQTEGKSAEQIAAEAMAANQASQAAKQAATEAGAGAIAQHRKPGDPRLLDKLEGRMVVQYDTLAGLKASQGRIVSAEDDKSLGEWVTGVLLSWQRQWLVTPGDMDAAKELVKFSSDPNTSEDGTDLNEHLKMLKEQGYTKAKKQERTVVVMALTGADKPSALVNGLVQMDLAPKSKVQFDRLRATVAWGLQNGSLTEDQAVRMKLSANVIKGDKIEYTRVDFATDKPAA